MVYGVSPDQLGGLVSSAYQNAINEKRQDGAKPRNLVPYLQQLVIREQIGGNANAFQAKDQPKDGEPQFVNARKMKQLNQLASSKLQQVGHQGKVSDLSNMFYTEVLDDWNALDAQTKKVWQGKANGDENGFYLFARNMLEIGEFG